MPEGRNYGCGLFGGDNECLCIILLLLVIFCCCGNHNRGFCN